MEDYDPKFDLRNKNQLLDSDKSTLMKTIPPERAREIRKQINEVMQEADMDFRRKQALSMEAASKIYLI